MNVKFEEKYCEELHRQNLKKCDEVKRERKIILANYIKRVCGVEVDVDSIFDIMAKRLHAYKRQLLNVMHIIYLYQRMKDDPNFRIYPRTFIFAAKAASAYTFAKKVIQLINAIADKVIIPLNDVFEKYCPNITAFLEEHPDIAKMISTDDGTYYCFPFLRGTSYENNPLLFSEGWVWRKDLLDKTGLDVPETPEELYEALVAFKEMGIEMPLSLRKEHVSRVLGPGFDSYAETAGNSFYVEDGVVKNGFIEPQRKEYLKFTNKLYEEGLLDNDYLSVDKNKLGVNVLNGLCGAAYAPGGSGIGTWLPAMRQSDPTVELVSSRPLSPEKGRLSKFAKMNNIYDASGSSSAITTACDNIEAVARFLDYAYSEEGMMFDNFGVEGDTYTMIDGYPTYTDKVVPTSEDGLTSEGYTISQALSMYTRTYATGGYIQDPRYIEQYYSLPELQEAIKLWSQTDFGKYMYPPATTTTEEASELAQIMNNIETFTDEMETKFITGAEDIDASWDSYIEQLHNFGIDRAIEIKQAAYDRYMAK